MANSKYWNLVRELEADLPPRSNYVNKPAEAIRSLLSLVSEMAEALEIAAVDAGYSFVEEPEIDIPSERKFRTLIEKAKEALGSQEDDNRSTGAES